MLSKILIILLFQLTIQNFETKYLYGIKYAIPLIHNSYLYLFGNKQIIYTNDLSSFKTSNTPSSDLTNEHQNIPPLYQNPYIITYVRDGNTFKFIKKKIESSESETRIISSKTLKSDGNICLFQMKFESINYYYYAWTDSDSYIHIARIDFKSCIKSNEKIMV